MMDRPPDSHPSNEAPIDTERGRPPGIPRWVKLLAIAGVVAVVLVVIVMLVAGGKHGPGRHIPGGGATPGGQASPVTATGPASADTLGDAAMQQHAEVMAHMPDGMLHDVPKSITLQPGETMELTWRFGAAGTLEYACHEPGHYEAGMRGRITVS